MTQRPLPQLGEDGRILEGVVTTLNEDDSLNISSMGPIVDAELETLVLRPFRTSTTYENLRRTRVGVFHVTDDVLLIAQAAVGTPLPFPQLLEAQQVAGRVLANACRWVEFQVESVDDHEERATIVAIAVARGANREFFGFNRAQYAVLEVAILATRLHLLPMQEVLTELRRLETPIEKTAGHRELEAFRFLRENIEQRISSSSADHRS
jgi:uncharacterized protein